MSEHVGVHSEIEKKTKKKQTVERKGRNSERSVKHKSEKVKGDKVGSTERESETGRKENNSFSSSSRVILSKILFFCLFC